MDTPKEHPIFVMARQMLDVERLDDNLENMLDRAIDLTKAAGGELVSRQAVACIIIAWEDSHV